MQLLIGDVFRRNAEHVPDRVAASLGERVLTHGQLDAAGNRLARGLRARGVRHGDRVLSWADTSLDVLPLFVALAKLGAVFAPLNARYGIDEARNVAGLARARLLVTDASHADAAESVARDLDIPDLARLSGDRGPGFRLDSTEGPDADVATPELRESDPHVLFFTSGSTGDPKGVVLSHRANWLRGFHGVFRDLPERSVCMFPLFHMAGFTLGLSAWHSRGEIAFVETASAEELLGAVERRRANRLYCIPAVWARILEASADRFDTASLREVDTGTSATPIELVHALKTRFPDTATRIYYGSTECGSAATLSDADVLRKPGSVGLPAPMVELRLSETSEICVKSPYLFDGYFEAKEATDRALRDGWYHTGDLGECDDAGYLTVTGRLAEIIRTGGESVSPGEVESVLAEHASVAEVAVVGIPDPEWGEIVCAVVVPAGKSVPRLETLQAHCDARIAGFKKPRRLECVANLPRTAATGQVQRKLLVERINVG